MSPARSNSASRCSTILREASRATGPSKRLGTFFLIATGGAGAAVASLPTIAIQTAVLLGAALSTVTFLMARTRGTLNAAWIVVAWLYLVGAIGQVLVQAGIGLSAAALLVVAPSPFVLTALFRQPQTRDRLILLTPLILLVLLAGVSLTWSAEASIGGAKLNVWILTGLLPAASILVLAPGSPSVQWKLIVAAAFVSAIALILFGTDSPLAPGRTTLFDANPIWVARATFIGALVVLFGPFPTLVKVGMTPVMIAAGLLTVSLGPFVGLLVGAWAGVAEKLRCADRTDRRLAIGWAGLGLIGGVAAVVVLVGVLDPSSYAVARLVVGDPNVIGRASFLGAALPLFLHSPVFGIGIGGFAATGLDLYPHNMIAEIAVELGVIGIVLFLMWFGLALRGAARSPLLVALVVASAVFSLFSGSLAGNAEFWMLSAFAVSTFPLSTKQRIGQAIHLGHG